MLSRYLEWQFVAGPRFLIVLTWNLQRALWRFFSVSLMLRTLFAHWHRDAVPYWAGTVSGLLLAFAWNQISRAIGLTVRLAVLLTWLVTAVVFLIGGALVVVGALVPPLGILAAWVDQPRTLSATARRRFIGKRLQIDDKELPPVTAVEGLLAPSLQQFWRQRGLTEMDVKFVIWWQRMEEAMREARRRWWTPEHLLAVSGIGISWAAGYTPLVDRLTRLPAGSLWDANAFGQEECLEQLINTLARRRESNVLLVGQPGVGRLGIIKELARRVRRQVAHPHLNGQRIVYLHVGELLAMGTSGAAQLAVISRALREMDRAGNIIAVFDGFGSLLGTRAEERVNLTEALLPFFASASVRVVVVMAAEEYHLRLAAHQELIHYFEVILVPEPSAEATLKKLALAVPLWERESGLAMPYQALKAAVETTRHIWPDTPFPEKAFDVMEEAIVAVGSEDRASVQAADIHRFITRRLGVPVGEIAAHERERLLQLEEALHRRIVNQAPAVSALARAMIRARAGVRRPDRPIGVFLFLGPTGVGKTETSKALAEAYFGSEDAMIRLDMSEFAGDNAIAQLIGDMDRPAGRLTAALAHRPFAVVLLDEFEKSSRMAQQLFLQVFDEGHLTDVRGRRFSFAQAIIIATSNAGAEFIRQEAQDGRMSEDFVEQLRDHILERGIFSPELLNRFDEVVTFTPLTQEQIAEVARRLLRALNQRLDEQHGVTVAVTPELVRHLVGIGYHPEFGARPMARAVADTVEYTVAQKILRGHAHPGEEIVLQFSSSGMASTRVPSRA